MDRSEIEGWYRGLQRDFCAAMESIDGGSFGADEWERPGGGGGVTRVLSGTVLEKAAVNFSAVEGDTPERLSERVAAASGRFYAAGISVIVHPANPHAPTFHANLRYFETDGGATWFGGGADLTPYYFYPEDARHFHTVMRDACDRHSVGDYPAWKSACDDYFHLPHRSEARGVGGIFFDHLSGDLDAVWEMQRDLGGHLAEAYGPILLRRIDTPHGDRERRWHELRRGRYVEFNLVWDRGTRFGIETGGRTESILASLPPRAAWEYDHEPAPGSPEATLLDLLRGAPRDWA